MKKIQNQFQLINYVTTASKLIDRLEILGFTLESAETSFEEGKSRLIKEAKESKLKNILMLIKNRTKEANACLLLWFYS